MNAPLTHIPTRMNGPVQTRIAQPPFPAARLTQALACAGQIFRNSSRDPDPRDGDGRMGNPDLASIVLPPVLRLDSLGGWGGSVGLLHSLGFTGLFPLLLETRAGCGSEATDEMPLLLLRDEHDRRCDENASR